jgi:hypothetical protein
MRSAFIASVLGCWTPSSGPLHQVRGYRVTMRVSSFFSTASPPFRKPTGRRSHPRVPNLLLLFLNRNDICPVNPQKPTPHCPLVCCSLGNLMGKVACGAHGALFPAHGRQPSRSYCLSRPSRYNDWQDTACETGRPGARPVSSPQPSTEGRGAPGAGGLRGHPARVFGIFLLSASRLPGTRRGETSS